MVNKYSCIKSTCKDCPVSGYDRVRNLKFATSKTLVNFMKKMMFCLKIGIFQFTKPYFTVHSTNLTSIHSFY